MSVNSAMYTGVSGLKSFSEAISAVSDNIANANTTGFKKNSVRFADMVGGFHATLAETSDRAGVGGTMMTIRTEFSQGPIQSTSNWSDLAIQGTGYYNVQAQDSAAPGTPTGSVYYTRDGGFRVDENGYMVNAEGFLVLDTAGGAIQVEPTPATPTYYSYYVNNDGEIYGNPVAGGSPVLIAQIRISSFPDDEGLLREGANLYLPTPLAGPVRDGFANDGIHGSVLANCLEGSNVDLAGELVDMVIYQADFTANSKSITTASQMLDVVNGLIR